MRTTRKNIQKNNGEKGGIMSVSELSKAIQQNDVEAVKKLLEHGADANSCEIIRSPDHIAIFPVLYSAAGGEYFPEGPRVDIDIIKLLLEHGADPNRMQRYIEIKEDGSEGKSSCRSALSIGIFATGSKELTVLFLKYGADPNIGDGENPALYAAASIPSGNKTFEDERCEIAERLLKHGADPNYSYAGEPTLFRAVFYAQSKRLVELLLEYGADRNAVVRFEHEWWGTKTGCKYNMSIEAKEKYFPYDKIYGIEQAVGRGLCFYGKPSEDFLDFLRSTGWEGDPDDQIF